MGLCFFSYLSGRVGLWQIPLKAILSTRFLSEKQFFSRLKKQKKESPPFKWWALRS